MPLFTYKALQADGKTAAGELEAGGRVEAFRQIEARGLRPISLKEKANGNGHAVKNGSKNGGVAATSSSNGKPAAGNFSLKFQSNKVTSKMLENFTRLLS